MYKNKENVFQNQIISSVGHEDSNPKKKFLNDVHSKVIQLYLDCVRI